MINYGRITDYKVMNEQYLPTYEMTIEGVRDMNRIDAISEILNHLDVFDNVHKVKALKAFLNSEFVVTTEHVDPNNGKEALKRSLNAIYGTRTLRYGIDKVIFSGPATIVIWKDGTKTVVKCSDKDIYDPEKGLAMAICKKIAGNTGNYYNIFKKMVGNTGNYYNIYKKGIRGAKEEPDYSNAISDAISDAITKFAEAVRKVYGEKNDEPEN